MGNPHSSFICPLCQKPVKLEDSQYGPGGRLTHPECQAKQDLIESTAHKDLGHKLGNKS